MGKDKPDMNNYAKAVQTIGEQQALIAEMRGLLKKTLLSTGKPIEEFAELKVRIVKTLSDPHAQAAGEQQAALDAYGEFEILNDSCGACHPMCDDCLKLLDKARELREKVTG